jgi:predicted transcriptional regulator
MFADDCETVLRLLIDEGPLTIDQIVEKTGFDIFKVNELLCRLLLAGRQRPVKLKVKGGRKVTHYEYREK